MATAEGHSDWTKIFLRDINTTVFSSEGQDRITTEPEEGLVRINDAYSSQVKGFHMKERNKNRQMATNKNCKCSDTSARN